MHFFRRWASRSRLSATALYQRVDAECDADILLGDALLFRLSPGRARRHWPFFSAEGDLDSRNADVLEQHVEVCRRKIRRRDAKPSESTPELRIFSASAFASLGAYDAHGLVYAPAVVRVRTAYVKGNSPACEPRELDALEVLGAVVGPDVETFARFPYQLALVISSFQVGRNHLFPLFGRNRREFGEQLFTFGICHDYLEISISVVSKLHVKVQNYYRIETRNCYEKIRVQRIFFRISPPPHFRTARRGCCFLVVVEMVEKMVFISACFGKKRKKKKCILGIFREK